MSARRISVASDTDFVEQLRFAAQRYLDAIDAWEMAYQKYYRMPAPGPVSSDLEKEHREYLSARGQLQEYIPNARRLCLKHSLRDPWPAMLHVNLGGTVPQNGFSPAIGRSERALIAQCLADLESASQGGRESIDRQADSHGENGPSLRRGILQRIVDYFL
jgi:hypothetical protein